MRHPGRHDADRGRRSSSPSVAPAEPRRQATTVDGRRSRSRAASRRRSACPSPSSPTARARRSSATARRSSPTGRSAATRRCASGSPSATASSPARVAASRTARCRASSSSPSSSCQPARARARRGADVRPAAEDPRGASAPRSSRCRWTTTASSSTRSSARSRRARSRRSSTRSRPSRTRAAARSRRERRRRARRARARARAARARGRPVRPRALRGRARRRRSSSSTAATTSSTPRRSRRRSRPGSASATSCCRRRSRAQIEALAVSTYISPALSTQATVHEFLRRGHFEPNLERVARPAAARAATRCSRRSSSTCPDGATWSRPEGGYFIWLDLRRRRRGRAARARGSAPASRSCKGTDFFADGSGTRSLRLAFSFVSPDEIAEGVARLAGLLRGAPAPARALAATAGSRRRSPTARPSRISQTSDTLRGRRTRSGAGTDLRFSSTNAIAYAASRTSTMMRSVELRLPRLLRLSGVERAGFAGNARARCLRGCVVRRRGRGTSRGCCGGASVPRSRGGRWGRRSRRGGRRGPRGGNSSHYRLL